MKLFLVQECMLLIIDQAVFIEIYPEQMPKYQANRYISEKKVKRLNYNREGSLLDFIEDFTDRFPSLVDEYETLLTDNRIWKQRTVDIGVVSPERAKDLGFHRAYVKRFRCRMGS